MPHRFPIRVYYEDTDLAGIVYHANYLRFIERARSEMVEAMGIDQLAMKGDGVVLAVRHIDADYLRPAQFQDDLVVETAVSSISGARMVMAQDVYRGADLLFAAKVTVIAMTLQGRSVRLPADIRRAFG
ncbi:YbgC/FadM family acyl-CoA thioesterase [Pseudoruegeria sp. HB172150]|uniref:YbgC/FadM family acyl-CoA thioesterase n=1 Tax=Pseudoruegeria sp. HB172150 TaxID=2721164 RepID=UPI001554DB04|nr:YbgC/FadM family acyl-CoA thioesterase [Pseudoruegeria sp. HB172150]